MKRSEYNKLQDKLNNTHTLPKGLWFHQWCRQCDMTFTVRDGKVREQCPYCDSKRV